jgi:DNA-binding MarR family transcriptional regulator
MKLEQAIQTQSFKDQNQKAMINLMYTSYQVKSWVSTTLKAYGLTTEQFNVLRILKGKHPNQMCVRDVAGRMIERSSNVPRIIDRLEVKKLVKRTTSSQDKRETVITLTQAGINMLQTVNPVIEQRGSEMCGLTNEELVLLNDLLDKYRKD